MLNMKQSQKPDALSTETLINYAKFEISIIYHLWFLHDTICTKEKDDQDEKCVLNSLQESMKIKL